MTYAALHPTISIAKAAAFAACGLALLPTAASAAKHRPPPTHPVYSSRGMALPPKPAALARPAWSVSAAFRQDAADDASLAVMMGRSADIEHLTANGGF
jgi:hypothetical protein